MLINIKIFNIIYYIWQTLIIKKCVGIVCFVINLFQVKAVYVIIKKKFHLNIKSEKNTETINKNTENTDNKKKYKKSLICDFCNKVFNYASSKAYHKKICKFKEEQKEQKEEIKNITINNQINNINIKR